MRIVRLATEHNGMEPYRGPLYVLFIRLTRDGVEALQEALDSAPTRFTFRMTEPYPEIPREAPDIVVTAHGVPLPGEDPSHIGYTTYIAVPIIREDDAFDAARAICPALVPDKVLEDGEGWSVEKWGAAVADAMPNDLIEHKRMPMEILTLLKGWSILISPRGGPKPWRYPMSP